MSVIDTEYSDQPCWMREYCFHRSAACLCSQPEDDGCPVYREFKNIFKKQGLLIEEKGEVKYDYGKRSNDYSTRSKKPNR